MEKERERGEAKRKSKDESLDYPLIPLCLLYFSLNREDKSRDDDREDNIFISISFLLHSSFFLSSVFATDLAIL